MAKSTKFHADVAERIGLGFELPMLLLFPVFQMFQAMTERGRRKPLKHQEKIGSPG
jgi:hypothetical protein